MSLDKRHSFSFTTVLFYFCLMLRVVTPGGVCFSRVFAFIGVCVAESSVFGLYAREGSVVACLGDGDWEGSAMSFISPSPRVVLAGRPHA